jgi:cytochrome c oxidase subunit 2
VEIVAERFIFTPSEIRVPVGTTLELRVRSDDTMHGFRIVGANVNVAVPKRRQGEAVVLFDATEVGRYRFECSRLCGAGHNFMRGEIVVVDR